MATPTIRPTRSADASALAALAAQLGYPIGADHAARFVAGLTADGDQAVLVAEDGEVVAWIALALRPSLMEEAPRVEVTGLVVDERRRAAGVGRALMAAGEAWARAKGARVVQLRSGVARERAHGFYRRLGYAVVKTQLVLRKELAEGGGRGA